MQQTKNEFYLLMSQVMGLEVIHETQLEEYNHLHYLYIGFGKYNKSSRESAKYQCDEAKKQIDDLIKKISELDLDNNMKNYYKLYIEKSGLLKKVWVCETEIGYLGSHSVFGSMSSDKTIADSRSQYSEQKKAANEKMEEVVLKMKEIYTS